MKGDSPGEEDQGDNADNTGPAFSKIGPYRLIREVGGGGMGVVYEALDERSEDRVALKLVHPYWVQSDSHRGRFEREIQIVGRLHHPGIARLHDFGEYEGRPYHVTEYVEGLPLSQLARTVFRDMDEKPTKVGDDSPPDGLVFAISRDDVEWVKELIDRSGGYFAFVADLALQAADALEYAHRQGVIHRDIKPSNLILTREGKVKILDFGIAAGAEFETLTTTGDFLGTPGYMSLEQVDPEVSEIGPATDVYSLGVTLYELVTGTPAFRGDTVSITFAIKHKEPKEPRKVDRTIPRPLNAVILKAIEKRVRDRYQSAREFADDLRRFLSGKKVAAKQGSMRWRLARLLRKRKKEAIILASLLLFIVAVIAGFRMAQSKKESEKLQRYEALITAATDAIDKGLFARAIPHLEEAVRLKETAEAKLKLWYARTLNRLLRVLGPSDRRALALAFDPSGRLLAAGYKDRSVRVWDLDSGRERPALKSHRADVTALCFSSDGRFLASGDYSGVVFVWDLSEGQPLVSSERGGTPVASVTFMPGGNRLFIASSDGNLSFLDPSETPQGQRRRHDAADRFVGCYVRANPSGRFFVAAGDTWAGVFHADSGEQSVSVDLKDQDFSAIAASENGDQLALGYPDGRVLLHSKTDATSRVLSENGERAIVELSFLQGDGYLLACDESGVMALWDLEQQRCHINIANECRGVSTLAASANGELAALAPVSGGIQLWRIDPGQNDLLGKVLIAPQDDVGSPVAQHHVAFSRRARWLASSDITGSISVWNRKSGDVVVTFNDCRCCPTGLVFSPSKEGLFVYACEDSSIRLYDLERREEIHRFTLPKAVPQALTFSQNGLLLAVGDRDSGITLYDMPTFTLKAAVRGGDRHRSVTDLRFLRGRPDLLASWTSDGRARFWKAKGSRLVERGRCEPKGALHTIAALSPSGEKIAAITRNGRLGIWNVKDQEEFELTDPGRDHSKVNRLIFSPDGRILASASDDMTVILWDVRQGREAICLTTKLGEPKCVAFDHTASRMAVGLASGEVLLYDFSTE